MNEIELLETIVNRLDLIYTVCLYGFTGFCVCLVLYMLFRFIRYFF